MYDLEIDLDDHKGALSRMGKALGQAGVSVEGGGAWVVDGRGVGHFLVKDADAAREALDGHGIRVAASSRVVLQRLRQDVPGQLGELTGRMAEAGVNIRVLYSDHDNQLVIVPDDYETAALVAASWATD